MQPEEELLGSYIGSLDTANRKTFARRENIFDTHLVSRTTNTHPEKISRPRNRPFIVRACIWPI